MQSIYEILYSIAIVIIFLFSPFNEKLKRFFLLRKYLIEELKRISDFKNPIWFHVSSAGELEQCIPILEIIRQKSNKTIFLSYFSSSAKNALEKINTKIKLWDYAFPSPLDKRKSVDIYLDLIKPSHLVLIHGELWLNLISACKKRNIPCYLFAALIEKKSLWWFLLKKILSKLTFIGTINSISKDFLTKNLEGVIIENFGDPRIDRVINRKNANKREFKEKLVKRNNFLFGSIWSDDFIFIQPSLKFLFENYRNWKIIIAPHEPNEDFTQEITNWFISQKQDLVKWSTWNNEESHIIVDTVGQLAELYSIATLSYIGGSAKRKVHNVLEPAVYGVPILTGPNISNSYEAIYFSQIGALIRASTGSSMVFEIEYLLKNDFEIKKRSKELLFYFEKRKGASEKYSSILLNNPIISAR